MKVGDYVRFYDRSWTEIGQITDFVEDSHLKIVKCRDGYYDLDNFIKSSPNLIDLIEVGDYVNGYLVKDIDYAFDDVVMNKKNARIVPYIDCNKDNYIDEIKSIVTKEQFSQMEYIIEE